MVTGYQTSDGGDTRAARGRAGEQYAQTLLERRGYRIVDVNVRSGAKSDGLGGELDIVAWDGDTLCFVEVKTRRGHGPETVPAAAVTPAKQRQIARLALAYVARCGLLSGAEEIPLRFDVVSVVLSPGREPTDPSAVRRAEVLKGAFLAPEDWEE